MKKANDKTWFDEPILKNETFLKIYDDDNILNSIVDLEYEEIFELKKELDKIIENHDKPWNIRTLASQHKDIISKIEDIRRISFQMKDTLMEEWKSKYAKIPKN